MLTVDDYGRIRRAYRDGMSIRAIARTFRHSRPKIRQVLVEPEPTAYTLTAERPAPKLGPFKQLIDQILTDDQQAPRKQRHTAAQIFRRLRDEHGYTGGYDQVRRYVGHHRRGQRETFIPLAHDPGQRLEVDFGHIHVDFPDGRRRVPVLMPTWSFSNAPFAKALPTERIECVLAGMVESFEFFGSVAREVWWDNPKTVVTAILKGRDRHVHERYGALASHYGFEPLFCMPARANEKPYTENKVFDLQRRWATPVPRVADLDELNAYLRRCCLAERRRTSQRQTETIGERLLQDQAAALALPPHRFDPCVHQPRRVDKYQTVAYDGNRYSVPRRWAFQTVTVKAYPFRIDIVAGGQLVAGHDRLYGHHEQSLNPLHYLVTVGRRPAALDHSGVYRNWHLPASFGQLRTRLEERHGPPAGVRQYIRVLQLLAEHPLKRVQQAVELALAKGWLEAELVRHHAERLALRDGPATDPQELTPVGSRFDVRVPSPDLMRFDRLLTTGG